MTKKEIVSLSLKLAGIYCLIRAIYHFGLAALSVVSSIAGLFVGASMGRQGLSFGFWGMLISITPFVLLLLFGFYLIFSNKLPSKMASSMIHEEKTTSFSFQDIQVLAFSIIGIWLVSSAIPAFFQPMVRIIIQRSASQRPVPVFQNGYLISQIVAAVLKLALGIYLFSGSGSKSLARLWQKFQSTRGMKPSN